jgi:hypothetical protein
MLKSMSRWSLALAVLACSTTSIAGDFWDGIHTGWHRNNEWPNPFIERDRDAAVAPFAVMTANGWQKQNLIGENYFDENTGVLTMAGRDRVRQILRTAPIEHRTLYVERDLNENVTSARMDEVQRTVASLQPKGPLPEVLASDMIASGRPASIVSGDLKAWEASAPTPRVGSKASSSGTGGGAAPTTASAGSGGS